MDNIGYILCETASSQPRPAKIISEANGVPTIETILQDMEVENRNKRYYATEDLAPAITAPRMLELLAARSLFGEAGHPTSKDIARQQTIDPTNMSHLIKKLWIEGNDIKGHVEPAQTRVGDDFKRLIDGGTSLAFSLRALGSIENTKRGAEVKNIRIVTWDWVIFPSHRRAYMQSIVNISESVMSGNDNNFICSETDSGLIVPINSQKVIDYIKESSKNIRTVKESFDFMFESIIINENAKSVILKDKDGTIMTVRLENFITNELMDYCSKL